MQLASVASELLPKPAGQVQLHVRPRSVPLAGWLTMPPKWYGANHRTVVLALDEAPRVLRYLNSCSCREPALATDIQVCGCRRPCVQVCCPEPAGDAKAGMLLGGQHRGWRVQFNLGTRPSNTYVRAHHRGDHVILAREHS